MYKRKLFLSGDRADTLVRLVRRRRRADDEALHAILQELVSVSERSRWVRSLQGLREIRGVSQAALAERLGIQQPAVSKIERREDVSLATLRSVVEALGGALHLTVTFDRAMVDLDL